MSRPRDLDPLREQYSPAQPRRTRVGLYLGLVALLLFLVAGRMPQLVESVYSQTIYPWLVWPLAAVSSLVPFSLAEIIFVLLVVALLVAPFAGWRRVRKRGFSRMRAGFGALVRLAGVVGHAWFFFLLLWGLNYLRPHPVPLFHLGPMPDQKQVNEFTRQIGQRLDTLRPALPEDRAGVVVSNLTLEDLDRQLAPLQARALEAAGLPGIEGGRAKTFLASSLLLRIGVSGVYGPFTGEPNVVTPSAPGLLPFTLAHERAHLSGLAWEEAASYAAVLTLLESDDPQLRYAVWLEMWLTLRPTTEGRSPGVRRDLRAIRAFYRRHRGREAPVFQAAYSSFLKAHGVKGGTRSYGRFANLVLRHLARDGFPPPPPGLLLYPPPERELFPNFGP